MSLLPKSIATAAAATLLAVCPAVAVAAQAHPASRHGGTHSHSTHTHSAHGKAAGKALHAHAAVPAGARRGATHAIAAQLKAVNTLVTNSGSLTSTDAAALHDALVADAAAVQADLAAVGDAGSRRDLHALMANAITTRQLARLQFETVVAADAAAEQAASLSLTVTTLQAQLADLGGVDTSGGLAALADAASRLESVSSKAPGVAQYVLALPPTTSRPDVHAANDAVEETLGGIADDLTQAAAEIAAVQAEYGL